MRKFKTAEEMYGKILCVEHAGKAHLLEASKGRKGKALCGQNPPNFADKSWIYSTKWDGSVKPSLCINCHTKVLKMTPDERPDAQPKQM